MYVKIDVADMIRSSSVYELRELTELLAEAYRLDCLRAEGFSIRPGEIGIEFVKRIRNDHPEWSLAECKRIFDVLNNR